MIATVKETNMIIKLDFENASARATAAQFIAELVRQGVLFNAHEQGSWLVIEMTGGF